MTQDDLLMSGEADYMSEPQLVFFKALLNSHLVACMERVNSGLVALSSVEKPSDDVDQASVEEERQKLLCMLERDRLNLPTLKKAMERIDEGSFGYCVESGDPIGIQRLLARPETTLCIEAKQRQEHREKHRRVV